MEDFIFKSTCASNNTLLDVSDGGSILHNFNHTCNTWRVKVTQRVEWQTHLSAKSNLFCFRWRCIHTVTGRDPATLSPRLTPWSAESEGKQQHKIQHKELVFHHLLCELSLLTCRISISCLRSSPSLKMMPMGSLDRVVWSALLNCSHSGFFLDAITLHCSVWIWSHGQIHFFMVVLQPLA